MLSCLKNRIKVLLLIFSLNFLVRLWGVLSRTNLKSHTVIFSFLVAVRRKYANNEASGDSCLRIISLCPNWDWSQQTKASDAEIFRKILNATVRTPFSLQNTVKTPCYFLLNRFNKIIRLFSEPQIWKMTRLTAFKKTKSLGRISSHLHIP